MSPGAATHHPRDLYLATQTGRPHGMATGHAYASNSLYHGPAGWMDRIGVVSEDPSGQITDLDVTSYLLVFMFVTTHAHAQ